MLKLLNPYTRNPAQTPPTKNPKPYTGMADKALRDELMTMLVAGQVRVALCAVPCRPSVRPSVDVPSHTQSHQLPLLNLNALTPPHSPPRTPHTLLRRRARSCWGGRARCSRTTRACRCVCVHSLEWWPSQLAPRAAVGVEWPELHAGMRTRAHTHAHALLLLQDAVAAELDAVLQGRTPSAADARTRTITRTRTRTRTRTGRRGSGARIGAAGTHAVRRRRAVAALHGGRRAGGAENVRAGIHGRALRRARHSDRAVLARGRHDSADQVQALKSIIKHYQPRQRPELMAKLKAWGGCFHTSAKSVLLLTFILVLCTVLK
jgi:hypothetical protein